MLSNRKDKQYKVAYRMYGFIKEIGEFDSYKEALDEVIKTHKIIKLVGDVTFEVYDTKNRFKVILEVVEGGINVIGGVKRRQEEDIG